MRIYRYVIFPIFLVGILLVFANSLGLFNKGVRTSVKLARINTDTTVHITLSRFGSPLPDEKRAGGQFFIKAKGEADQHVVVKVFYRNRKDLAFSCILKKGIIDTAWGGDFYTSEAIVDFQHNQSTKGKLYLEFIFSYPPKEWNVKLK